MLCSVITVLAFSKTANNPKMIMHLYTVNQLSFAATKFRDFHFKAHYRRLRFRRCKIKWKTIEYEWRMFIRVDRLSEIYIDREISKNNLHMN